MHASGLGTDYPILHVCTRTWKHAHGLYRMEHYLILLRRRTLTRASEGIHYYYVRVVCVDINGRAMTYVNVRMDMHRRTLVCVCGFA
jgi:hypothetical protein